MMFFHQISPTLLALYTARLLQRTPKSDKLLFYHRSIQTNGEYYDVYKKMEIQKLLIIHKAKSILNCLVITLQSKRKVFLFTSLKRSWSPKSLAWNSKTIRHLMFLITFISLINNYCLWLKPKTELIKTNEMSMAKTKGLFNLIKLNFYLSMRLFHQSWTIVTLYLSDFQNTK